MRLRFSRELCGPYLNVKAMSSPGGAVRGAPALPNMTSPTEYDVTYRRPIAKCTQDFGRAVGEGSFVLRKKRGFRVLTREISMVFEFSVETTVRYSHQQFFF